MELTQKTSLQKLKERNYMRYQNYILKITQSSLPYGIIFYFMILLNLIFLFIEILGKPSKIKLELGKDNFDLNITLEYKQLELIINYCVNFYLGTRIPEFQTLFFVVEKLYLDNEVIKIGEDVRKVFTKVKRYTKNNYKIFNYEYNIGEYSGSYDFNNLDLTIYFEKYGKKRIVDGIYVSLPYEDNPNVSNIGEILKLDILKNIFEYK